MRAALPVESTWSLANAVTQRLCRVETGGARAQLPAFVALMIGYNEENAPDLAVASQSDYGVGPNERFTNPLYTWLYAVLTTLLRRAQRDGALADADISWLGDALLAMVEPGVYHYQRERWGILAEQILTSAQALITRVVS